MRNFFPCHHSAVTMRLDDLAALSPQMMYQHWKKPGTASYVGGTALFPSLDVKRLSNLHRIKVEGRA